MRGAAAALLLLCLLPPQRHREALAFLPPVDRVAKSEKSANPLYDAARAGDVGRVEELLAEGEDVNLTLEEGGWQPIHAAVQSGHEAVVRTPPRPEGWGGEQGRRGAGWTDLSLLRGGVPRCARC